LKNLIQYDKGYLEKKEVILVRNFLDKLDSNGNFNQEQIVKAVKITS
jgi:hypothetical protein